MKQKLDFSNVLRAGFKTGLANFLPLLLTSILYVVTVWIPYINVGTTIAILTIPAKLSKGEKINPTSIFDAKYRERMGEFFLVSGFQSVIIGIGMVFCFIPGIVMAYTYLFAPLLVVDKGVDPIKALGESSKMTKGNKLTMFFVLFVLALPMIIPILNFIYMFLYGPVVLATLGYIYGELQDEPQAESEEVPAE